MGTATVEKGKGKTLVVLLARPDCGGFAGKTALGGPRRSTAGKSPKAEFDHGVPGLDLAHDLGRRPRPSALLFAWAVGSFGGPRFAPLLRGRSLEASHLPHGLGKRPAPRAHGRPAAFGSCDSVAARLSLPAQSTAVSLPSGSPEFCAEQLGTRAPCRYIAPQQL